MMGRKCALLFSLFLHSLGIGILILNIPPVKKGTAGMQGTMQVTWVDAGQPAPVSVKPDPVIKPPKEKVTTPKPALLSTKPHLLIVKKSEISAQAHQVQQVAKETSPPSEATSQSVGKTDNPISKAGTKQPPNFRADYLSNPAPEYPSLSRMLHEQGIVKLRVHVTTDGKPDAITVESSSGYARLDQAAITAVWHWRFEPAKENGQNIADEVIVPVHFTLQK